MKWFSGRQRLRSYRRCRSKTGSDALGCPGEDLCAVFVQIESVISEKSGASVPTATGAYVHSAVNRDVLNPRHPRHAWPSRLQSRNLTDSPRIDEPRADSPLWHYWRSRSQAIPLPCTSFLFLPNYHCHVLGVGLWEFARRAHRVALGFCAPITVHPGSASSPLNRCGMKLERQFLRSTCSRRGCL